MCCGSARASGALLTDSSVFLVVPEAHRVHRTPEECATFRRSVSLSTSALAAWHANCQLPGNMTGRLLSRLGFLLPAILVFMSLGGTLSAQDAAEASAPVVEKTLDQKIDEAVGPYTEAISKVVFFPIWKGQVGPEGSKVDLEVPFVLLWLAGAAIFLTIFFRFINLRAFGLALKTVRGKYSKSDDPGEITHFQALTAAVSGTVGLGKNAESLARYWL